MNHMDPDRATSLSQHGVAAPGQVSLEVTWWDDDGIECKGKVSVTTDASPGTTAALVQMMRSAEAAPRRARHDPSDDPPARRRA